MGATRPPRKLLELWWQNGSRDPEKNGRGAQILSPCAAAPEGAIDANPSRL
jgi:hypothetical protein